MNLNEIQFDDIKNRIDDKGKSKYKITHHLVIWDIAKGLKLKTLTGKYMVNIIFYNYKFKYFILHLNSDFN